MFDPDETSDVYAETAGDPGEAADLPATTGRDPEADIPDTEFHDEDGEAA